MKEYTKAPLLDKTYAEKTSPCTQDSCAESVKVLCYVPYDCAQKSAKFLAGKVDFFPSKKDRADGRQDTGWDLMVFSREHSKRTLRGKWDKLLRILTFGLYKPVPCYIKVGTGVRVQAEDKTVGFCIRMNSRHSKSPFILGNAVGTIDPGYTGELKLIFNTLSWATWRDIEEFFCPGNIIGQLVPERQVEVKFERVKDRASIESTSRGTGGFGSTARKVSCETVKK